MASENMLVSNFLLARRGNNETSARVYRSRYEASVAARRSQLLPSPQSLFTNVELACGYAGEKIAALSVGGVTSDGKIR